MHMTPGTRSRTQFIFIYLVRENESQQFYIIIVASVGRVHLIGVRRQTGGLWISN